MITGFMLDPIGRARSWVNRSTVLASLIVVIVCLFGAPVFAQAPASPPAEAVPQASDEQLRDLVETLRDESAREHFVGRLEALLALRETETKAEAEKPDTLGAIFLATVSAQVQRVSGTVAETAQFFAEAPLAIAWVKEQIKDPEARQGWTEVITKLAMVLGISFVAQWLARWLLSMPRRAIEAKPIDSWLTRTGYLVAMTLLDLVPLAVFAGTAYGLLPLTEPRPVTRLVALAVINANLIGQGIVVVARLLLAPTAPSLRLFRMADETSNYLFIWSRRFAYFIVYGYFGLEAARLLGLPPGAHTMLLKLLGLIVTLLLIVLILQNRASVAGWIRGKPSSGDNEIKAIGLFRRRLAGIWHVFAMIYVLGVFLVWTLGITGGVAFILRGTLISFAIVVATGVVSVILDRTINRAFAISPELRARFPALEQRANRYLPMVQRGVDVVIYVIAALAILQTWGIEAVALIFSEAGRGLLGGGAKLFLIIAGAVVVWELLSLLMERYLTATDQSGATVERSARARTLLQLARKALLGFLVVMVSFLVMAEIGINIAPLIAGAGVVGLAIGFGAQSLVKDVITGFFMLFEDTFAVGDVVDLGGNAGVVEAISIRTVRLRDLSGTVHMIPYGDVSRVMNLTKDFSFAVFDIGIAYRESVDQVIEVVKQLGAEMKEDPTYGAVILEPLEILGVNEFADSAVIIKARIKTKPIKQWMVLREFNRRMKNRFDELGIEIPFPHQTIYFGVDRDGNAPPAWVRMKNERGEAPVPTAEQAPSAPVTVSPTT